VHSFTGKKVYTYLILFGLNKNICIFTDFLNCLFLIGTEQRTVIVESALKNPFHRQDAKTLNII
jgi:hypothetical protein